MRLDSHTNKLTASESLTQMCPLSKSSWTLTLQVGGAEPQGTGPGGSLAGQGAQQLLAPLPTQGALPPSGRGLTSPPGVPREHWLMPRPR